MNWHSIKDKLPKAGSHVLICGGEFSSVTLGYLWRDKYPDDDDDFVPLFEEVNNEDWTCGPKSITHWMPLPEMPKNAKYDPPVYEAVGFDWDLARKLFK